MSPDSEYTMGELGRRITRNETDLQGVRERNHELASEVQAVRLQVTQTDGKVDRVIDQVGEARSDVATVAKDLDGFKKAAVGMALGMLTNLVLTLIVLVLR